MKNFRFYFILLVVAMSSFAAMAQVPTSNLMLWLKSDAGVDTVGGKVYFWQDQSGNGNTAIENTDSRRPLFLADALNGKPVIQFDGINDKLSLTGSTTMSSLSLFIVFKADSGLSGINGTDPLPYFPINFNNYGISMRNFFSLNSPNIIQPFIDPTSYISAEAPNIAAYDQWKALSVITNQHMWNTTVRCNGVDAVMTNEGTSNELLNVTLGRIDGSDGIGEADNEPADHLIFKGEIAEVIFYNAAISESDRATVENYLYEKYGIVTGVQESQGQVIPETFSLSQNYPNPFNPTTAIQFEVPNSSFVTLKVYDILGREVASLVNEQKAPGNYSANFNAARLASGVYFYRLQATPVGGSSVSSGQVIVQTKKMILLK